MTYGDLGLGSIVQRATRVRHTAADLCYDDPMFESGCRAFGQTGAAQSHLANQGPITYVRNMAKMLRLLTGGDPCYKNPGMRPNSVHALAPRSGYTLKLYDCRAWRPNELAKYQTPELYAEEEGMVRGKTPRPRRQQEAPPQQLGVRLVSAGEQIR
ncbi:MAG: hypothetical protein F4089_10945 [Gammaproteobacteria bacterium]|nr:hypothetical protein [Gammaproteobacteria bacterium]